MNDNVNVVMASNRRYLPGLSATLVSMINAASDKKRLQFYVFSDGLSEDDKLSLFDLARQFGYNGKIRFIEPDMKPLETKFKAYNGSFTPFLRLFFAEFLPDLDWVLWSDVDVLWFRDPLLFWEEKDDSVSVVWVKDVPSSRKSAIKQARKWRPDVDVERYSCSGVMLMNLRKMRDVSFVQRSLEFVAKWGSPLFADQGVLNEICHDDAKMVDSRWDLMYPVKSIGDGVVVHFNGIGPLFGSSKYEGYSPLYEIWFRYRDQILYGRNDYEVRRLTRKVWYSLLKMLYPFHKIIAFFTDPIHPWVSDFIQRNLFFAWLREKTLWRQI